MCRLQTCSNQRSEDEEEVQNVQVDFEDSADSDDDGD